MNEAGSPDVFLIAKKSIILIAGFKPAQSRTDRFRFRGGYHLTIIN